ncbi:hypothetical protein ASF43_05825 [Pseudorhodoferax sp. Leaf267]|nr:hypothetical protein ASF43_05825 [Pseudorhodoferax sp. Leaf267]
MEQRIKEGEGYLLRMRNLLQRTRETQGDVGNMDVVIAEMQATQQSFIGRRDELARALRDAQAGT